MKRIRNIWLIMFALGLTLPKEAFHLALHLPAYIQHFKHHNEEHGTIGWIEFISEHSGGTGHRDSDHPEDQPFDHQHSSGCYQVLTFIPFFNREHISIELIPTASVKMTLRPVFLTSGFSQTIWQPPKQS